MGKKVRVAMLARGVYLEHVHVVGVHNMAYRVFNPQAPKLASVIFKNSVRTAKKTPQFTITEI
jgi:fibrillarin-like rRNA methylase